MNNANFVIAKVGKGDKDEILYYASSLRDIIHVAINHEFEIPADVQGIYEKINHLHKIIDKKFPDVITTKTAEKWFREGEQIG